jgi:hypothetical protein
MYLSPTGTNAVCLLSASCWFLAWLILWPWSWRSHVPPHLTFNRLNCFTSQNAKPLITTAVGTTSQTDLLLILSFSLLHYWERTSEITIQCLLIFTLSLEHWTLHLTPGSQSTSSTDLWWILLFNANELRNWNFIQKILLSFKSEVLLVWIPFSWCLLHSENNLTALVWNHTKATRQFVKPYKV